MNDDETPLSFSDITFSSQESNAGIKWEDITAPINSCGEADYGYNSTTIGTGESLSIATDDILISTDSPDAFMDNWPTVTSLQWPINPVDEGIVSSSYRMPESRQVPSKTNWGGDFGFDVKFTKQKAVSGKNPSYDFSETLDKLFISMNVSCIVEFHAGITAQGLFIRAEAQYEKPEDIMQVVKRCPNHERPEDISNHGFSKPEHLIRCESDIADYRVDSATGRFSVIHPYIPPSVGADSFSCIYKFMCLGSCVGGINRRPLNLVFTLETADGMVFGRRVINLRICACPMRDLKGEEAQHQKRLSGGDTRVVKRTSKVLAIEPHSKKSKSNDQPGNFPITINAPDMSTYDMLVKLKQTIEVSRLVPPEVARNYLRNQENNLGSGGSAVVCGTSSITSASYNQTIDQNRCEVEHKRIKVEHPESLGDADAGAQNHSSSGSVEHSTASFSSSQENQNNSGLFCISRVSFTRVTSLKRGEQPPPKSQ